MWESIFVIFLIIVAIIALIVSEYVAHDCIPGKNCTHKVDPPDPTASQLEYVDRLIEMVKNNYDYVTWRISLLAGIIIAILSILFLKGRIPTLVELIIITGIGFLTVYFAFSWMWAHFFYPNGKIIEDNLKKLRDKIQEREQDTGGNTDVKFYNKFRDVPKQQKGVTLEDIEKRGNPKLDELNREMDEILNNSTKISGGGR